MRGMSASVPKVARLAPARHRAPEAQPHSLSFKYGKCPVNAGAGQPLAILADYAACKASTRRKAWQSASKQTASIWLPTIPVMIDKALLTGMAER